jgi:hypothetical protein
MALGCAGAALVAAGCGLTSTKTVTTTVTKTVTRTVTNTVTTSGASNACTAHDLTATFQVLPGSAGAGNIVYTLKVTYAAQAACTVHGAPHITFLDAAGNAMAAHVSPAGGLGAVVALQPGGSATSQTDPRNAEARRPCGHRASTGGDLHIARRASSATRAA